MSDPTTSVPLSRRVPWAVPAGLLAGATLVHLGTQLRAPESVIADVTQVLLMPLLVWCFLTAVKARRRVQKQSVQRHSVPLHSGESEPHARLVRLVLVALFFSWLGDTVPRFLAGDTAFLTLVGMFLIAQIVYIVAFWPSRRYSVAARRLGPVWLLPYLGLFALLLVLCAPHAGNLLVPVILYGVALMTMAVLATGLGVLAGIGGAVFFVSDGLIAVRSLAGISLPAHDFLIMSTYIAAQVMIVLAIVRRTGPSASRPGR
ncbi:lysoplasmalogenase [Brevibacterium yomogidense]|uniref:lysoplasmalogenase n=1 Tax=Brevibacterium yomogidense TaxID=946573 RepID=UPI0018DFD96F|nr:lysoplasmalogenase [Brevibacterium yomogidense]